MMTITEAQQTDIPSLCKLMIETFGPHSQLEEFIKKWVNDESFSVLVAKNESSIIGLSTVHYKKNPDLSKFKLFGKIALETLAQGSHGSFLNLAVDPRFRKQGIGWNLALKQLVWLKQKESDLIVGISWVSGSLDNSRHLFEKTGFTKLGESHEFMRDQLRQVQTTCNACKKQDCDCNSILFMAKLTDIHTGQDR